MTNKPRVYEGRLAEPLGAPPSILGSEDLEAESAAYDAEIKLRLDLLMEHYGISQTAPDRWQALALRLAQVHVPGLRPYRYPNSANGTVFVAMRVTYLMKFRGFSVAQR